MRAREFVINVPITIKINGDEDPKIDTKQSSPSKDPSELDPNPIFVSPLQQELELKKADAGKNSPVIQDITQDEEELDDYQDLETFFRQPTRK